MTYRSVGIIPAAGKAQRFGGVMKELLPVHDGSTLLSSAYMRLLRVSDKIVIVSNPEKMSDHARALERFDAVFVNQNNQRDILGAIQTAMLIEAEQYYFTMPDTYMDSRVFYGWPPSLFAMGTFTTNTPERYGVIHKGHVINKRADLPTPATAWGVLAWSDVTRDIWMSAETYTQAINGIIDKYGYETWDIGEYFDNASIDDYMEFLKRANR